MFFLALALLNITKAYKYALFGILGTLSSAIAGYSIGHFAWHNPKGEFTGLAQFLLNNIPGFSEAGYNKIHILYAKLDFWILFIAAALPLIKYFLMVLFRKCFFLYLVPLFKLIHV